MVSGPVSGSRCSGILAVMTVTALVAVLVCYRRSEGGEGRWWGVGITAGVGIVDVEDIKESEILVLGYVNARFLVNDCI